MQGLQSGNHTSQARMLGMAGNIGNAMQLYAFVVDDTCPCRDQRALGGSQIGTSWTAKQ